MIQTIKKRSEFVKIGKYGVAIKTKGVIVLSLESDVDKVGYTASKRVGNAVLRNKAKRRLRHLVREFENLLQGGFSFILIANFRTPTMDFSVLKSDFENAIQQTKKHYNNKNLEK